LPRRTINLNPSLDPDQEPIREACCDDWLRPPTCQVLDAVIAAEEREPTADPRFEYELDAMARQYLPSVLRNYLAIAPSRVHERQPNGRTPDEELTEQLRILAGQSDALYASHHRRVAADLSTTGNFLRAKYGHLEADAPDFGVQ
ncbi:hypothetical protein, partial [Cellulomonas sp. PhB150]|uniref:hypothetical protein n=1 Tax=Cellulomonas sp. PhB150 TaxID=2485188 RepID=UPI000F939B79